MSLINQMLKDLETRSAQPAQPEVAMTGLHATFSKESGIKKSYLLIIGLFAFLLVWAWNISHYYFTHHRSSPQVEKTKALSSTPVAMPVTQLPVATSVIAPIPAVTPHPTQTSTPATENILPAALTGITMQVHGKMTFLRFLLDKDAFYQVNSDPLQHSIIITLKNTHLTVNIPPLDYQNSALTDLKILHEDKDALQVFLMLKPEAKLSNLELNKESNYPELQADFLMEAPPQVAVKPLEPVSPTVVEPQTATLNKVAVAMTSDEQYQEAIHLAELGEKDKAIQQLAVLVDKYPEYNLAREALISLLMQQGNQGKAEELLATGLQLQPYYPPFIEFKAHLLVDEGKIHQALTLLKKAPPALATNPDYYAFIAALYQRLGQLPSAENLYQQLTALHPEKGVWWLGLGVTEEGLGKNSQALEAYAKADRSQDLDPELRGYVGTRLRG